MFRTAPIADPYLRWRQSVKVSQSRCWTSARPSTRYKPCCRPSEYKNPNHISPFHPLPRSYRGHHDANFNVAILDGHKEIVAHEKFQQLLHKKWGQRDKIHYGDDIRCSLSQELSFTSRVLLRYNIFWSEMSKVQKLGHVIKQVSRLWLQLGSANENPDENDANVGSCDRNRWHEPSRCEVPGSF